MLISERSLTTAEQGEFASHAKKGLRLIGRHAGAKASHVVASIDAYVQERQQAEPGWMAKLFNKPQDTCTAAVALGVVWGNQLVREFGWEWICITSGQSEQYAVAPPDRSLVIYATQFIKECLDSREVDCTVLLSFKMLLAGAVPEQEALSYTSVMPAVIRVGPRGKCGRARVPDVALFGVRQRDGRRTSALVAIEAMA